MHKLLAILIVTGSILGAAETPPEIIRKSDSHYVLTSAVLNSTLSNLNETLQSARTDPYRDKKTRAVVGFELVWIEPKSVFLRLGLRKNDVLLEINGVVLNNSGKGMQIFQTLLMEKITVVKILRAGKPLQIQYELKG